MPKPKFNPWEDEKRNKIFSRRVDRGYRSAETYSKKLTECGMPIERDAYLRRERGETPINADEVWYYAYLLQIDPLEALKLYSREPTSEEVLLYAKNALKRFEETKSAS